MPVRMHTDPVARVYAQSLLQAAGPKGAEIGAQLEGVAEMLRDAADLRVFLESPAVEAGVKKAAIEKLRGRIDDLLVNFLCVLVDRSRIGELESIAAAYADLADEAANRVRVQVTSAAPLEAEQRRRLEELLRAKLQSDLVLETEVEPALLGGLVLQVGDRVYEGSVRGWLQRMRQQMVRSSGYED